MHLVNEPVLKNYVRTKADSKNPNNKLKDFTLKVKISTILAIINFLRNLLIHKLKNGFATTTKNLSLKSMIILILSNMIQRVKFQAFRKMVI